MHTTCTDVQPTCTDVQPPKNGNSVASISKINIDHPLVRRQAQSISMEISFYVVQAVVEVANTESDTNKIDLILLDTTVSAASG